MNHAKHGDYTIVNCHAMNHSDHAKKHGHHAVIMDDHGTILAWWLCFPTRVIIQECSRRNEFLLFQFDFQKCEQSQDFQKYSIFSVEYLGVEPIHS